MLKKKLINTIIATTLLLWFANAYKSIDLDDYTSKLKTLETQKTKDEIENNFAKIKSKECNFEREWDYFFTDPICLRTKQYPEIWFRETVDEIRKHTYWFKNEYQSNKNEFTFTGSIPEINYSEISLPYYYHNSLIEKEILYYLEKNNIKIKVHKKFFARYNFENYTIYAVKRNRNGLWDCAFTNYRVWLSALNWLYLKPWELFNINKAISFLPWYCKWSTNYDLAFYWWTCGSAWQLFKTSLIMPEIDITKRYPHIRRRASFYGTEIYWDDAAILDMTKQFEIQNNGFLPIYFRTLLFEDYDYFVAIYPWKNTKSTDITRKQTWILSAEVSKIVKDKNLNVIKEQFFPSKYWEYFDWWI